MTGRDMEAIADVLYSIKPPKLTNAHRDCDTEAWQHCCHVIRTKLVSRKEQLLAFINICEGEDKLCTR